MKTDISLFLDSALRRGVNFYAVRRPGRQSVFEYGCSDRTVPGIGRNGFAVATFDGSSTITIPPDSKDPGCFQVTPAQRGKLEGVASTDRREHRAEIEAIQDSLARSGNGKVVAARRLVVKGHVNVAEVYVHLCESYPWACVFCFYTPRHGLWLGATPESLLSCHDKRLRTMALAGTRPRTNDASAQHPFNFNAPAWDTKNIDEQQLVVDFITDCLGRHHLSPDVSWRFTRTAGPVEHCCTSITAKTPHAIDLGSLLRDLSPTPAVCGSDREEAGSIINRFESFNRQCYGGFFGPVKAADDFDLYVNLRSCRVYDDGAALFAGGGITLLSDPDDEWNETERKLSTLVAHLGL